MLLDNLDKQKFNKFLSELKLEDGRFNVFKVINCPWNASYENKYLFIKSTEFFLLNEKKVTFLLNKETLEKEYINDIEEIFFKKEELKSVKKRWSAYRDLVPKRKITLNYINKDGDIEYAFFLRSINSKLNENKKDI